MNAFTSLHSTILQSLNSHDFKSVLVHCEEMEFLNLQVGASVDKTTFVSIYMIQFLTHILLDELEQAKFLWNRISDEDKHLNPNFLMLWDFFQVYYNRFDYTGIWEAFSAIKTKQWNTELATLLSLIESLFFQKTFNVIKTTYQSISTQSAMAYLGRNRQEVVQEFENIGWKLDVKKDYLFSPKDPYGISKSNDAHTVTESVDRKIMSIAAYSLYLENST